MNIKIIKFNRSNPAFSLAELIVSIFIIVVITAIFFGSYHNTNKRSELIMENQNLAQIIKTAQSNSLGLVEYNGEIPLGGWGVHFDKNTSVTSYILFADINQNLVYDLGEADSAYGGRTIQMPPGITLYRIYVGGEVSAVDITFTPPDPITNIYAQSATSSLAEIWLTEDVGNTRKYVSVNFLGMVDAIDYASFCNSSSDCSDGNDCTNDSCSSGFCVFASTPLGSNCGVLCQSCNGAGLCSNTAVTEDYQGECDTTGCGIGYCSGAGACSKYTDGAEHNCQIGEICSATGVCIQCSSNSDCESDEICSDSQCVANCSNSARECSGSCALGSTCGGGTYVGSSTIALAIAHTLSPWGSETLLGADDWDDGALNHTAVPCIDADTSGCASVDAMAVCQAYIVSTFGDWYLGARNEVSNIYTSYPGFFGSIAGYFMSSSEINSLNYYGMDNDGNWSSLSKVATGTNMVICIRKAP